MMGLWNQTIRPRFAATVFSVALFSVAVCLMAVAPPAMAQETLPVQDAPAGQAVDATKPVLVVTLGSMNKLMQDINYITAAVGQPNAGGMFTMLAGTFTQGIDMTQPIGVLVPLVNGAPQPIAVLPTNDVKSILKRLEAQTGPADELSDGTLVIAVGANTIYIRQMGPWAVLAPQKDLLALAPADPTTLFVGMGNAYDIALKLQMQQVPAETRSLLVAQIRQGFEQAMQSQGQGDAEAARDLAAGSMDQLEQFINETDELSFGINIDQSGQQVVIDSAFTAVPGTSMASAYGGQKAVPSQFSWVIREDAAAYYHAAMSISPEAVDATRTSMQTSIQALGGALENEGDLSPEQKAKVKIMIDRVAALAMKSIEEGRADIGALLLADQNDFKFVAGSFVADGNEAAQIVKDLAEEVKNETDAPRFKFDLSTYKGVAMHMVEADLPADEDEARRVFGETLRVHIGTGPKAVYLAVGNDSEGLMKQLIDNGASDHSTDRPVGQLKVTMKPILQYALSVEPNDTISAMINALESSPDAGLMTVQQDSVPNGQTSKIVMGEGMIKAIVTAVMESRQKAMNQF